MVNSRFQYFRRGHMSISDVLLRPSIQDALVNFIIRWWLIEHCRFVWLVVPWHPKREGTSYFSLISEDQNNICNMGARIAQSWSKRYDRNVPRMFAAVSVKSTGLSLIAHSCGLNVDILLHAWDQRKFNEKLASGESAQEGRGPSFNREVLRRLFFVIVKKE